MSWETALPLWTPPLDDTGAGAVGPADYVLHEETLARLAEIEIPFRVLSVMGRQRIGKSTLLGMLARGRQDSGVFAARRGADAVTRGLWVCFIAPGHRDAEEPGEEGLLLVDCEGTDNVGVVQELDRRLCALTFFLSHGVIVPYNEPQTPGAHFRASLTETVTDVLMNGKNFVRVGEVQLTVAFFNSDYYGFLETEQDRERFADLTAFLAGTNADAAHILRQLLMQTVFLPHPLQPHARTRPRLPEVGEEGYPLQRGDDRGQLTFWDELDRLRSTATGEQRASFASGSHLVRLLRVLPFGAAEFRLSEGAEAFVRQLVAEAAAEMRADLGLADHLLSPGVGGVDVDRAALNREAQLLGERIEERAGSVLAEARMAAARASAVDALERYVLEDLLPAARERQRRRCEETAAMLLCMFKKTYLHPVLHSSTPWHAPLQAALAPAVQTVVGLYTELALGEAALDIYRAQLRAPLLNELEQAFEQVGSRRGWEAAAGEQFNAVYWHRQLAM